VDTIRSFRPLDVVTAFVSGSLAIFFFVLAVLAAL
jgi:hypothetical protein